MKILPGANTIGKDLQSTTSLIMRAANEGVSIANRTANIYKQNKIHKYVNITRSVSGKVIKGTTLRELPYVAGVVGMLLPLPFSMPILMGLGYIIRNSGDGAKIMYENMSKSHINVSI